MTTLRLIADDLTGALDTAAEFVGLTGPVHVVWRSPAGSAIDHRALPANAALDLGTRETDRATACAATAAALPALRGASIAFKKIDSMMRGQTLPELAACYAAGVRTRVVLAPAFPFQGRITRGGQQFVATDGGWAPVGPDLVGALRAFGVPARGGDSLSLLAPGITVFDAETDAHLDAVVAAAGGVGAPVLWCGTGGLARALAGRQLDAPPDLPRPFLGLFGSDQPATAAQLAACAPHWLALPNGEADAAMRLTAGMARHGVALASHDLPPGLSRIDAATRIDAAFRGLMNHLPKPGTLVVAGGETLRGLCDALGASSLEVLGRVVPGVPVSRLHGGAWDGIRVMSKSGAFGAPGLLRELLCISDIERTAP